MREPGHARVNYVGARVVDVVRSTVLEDAVLVTEGTRVSGFGRRADYPRELPGQVVDCTGATIVPGLFNCHVHLALDGDATPYPIKLPYLRSLAEPDLFAIYAEQARRNLLAGVTTVRDTHPGPGGQTTTYLVLQEALRRGLLVGSRVYLSLRPLVVPGGHGTHWLSRAVSGADETVRAVRENVAEGANLIKLMTAFAWGPLPGKPESWSRYFAPAELRAAVDTAHGHGLPVAAHAHGTKAILDCVAAGVDSIEHGTGLTPELVELMAQRGTFLVPTLASYHNFHRAGPGHGETDARVGDSDYVRRRQREGLELAIRAGVRIAAGTDSGFVYLPHGDVIVDELELYVECGMSPMGALRSATRTAAQLVGVVDELGSLEPGMVADLLVVDGAPDKEITALRAIRRVVKEGRAIEPDAGSPLNAEPLSRNVVRTEMQNTRP
ncbi:metal-dependent hydrolase family protein [Pseudonocardia acaciae]|uniref:metal-dependent hydrolase family protein n=1 Tax=Pseudonocardia acaciae TaxID=551276 RepID=UPI00146FD3D8|nr:amidohydrolase family protein [Pseudonocardia acaciae]